MTEAHHPRFPDVVLPHLDSVQLSPLSRVRLRQPDVPALSDPLNEITAALDSRADLFALAIWVLNDREPFALHYLPELCNERKPTDLL